MEIKIPADFIIETVSWYLGIHPRWTYGRTKTGAIQEARQIAVYFVFKYTNLKTCEIAKVFNRNHASVIYSKATVENFIKLEPDYAAKVHMTDLKLIKEYFIRIENIEQELVCK